MNSSPACQPMGESSWNPLLRESHNANDFMEIRIASLNSKSQITDSKQVPNSNDQRSLV
jgi:hypothetical protein